MFPVMQFPKAVCLRVDPDVMFPSAKDTKGIALAKATCAFCPHNDECMEAALATPAGRDEGVRAGTTQDERRKIRRRRAAATRKGQQALAA